LIVRPLKFTLTRWFGSNTPEPAPQCQPHRGYDEERTNGLHRRPGYRQEAALL
jgi:hypothetical protein